MALSRSSTSIRSCAGESDFCISCGVRPNVEGNRRADEMLAKDQAAYGRVRLTIRLERCVCSTHCFKELNIDPLLEHERLQASHDKREPKLVKSEKAAVLVFKASVYNLLGNGMRDLVAAMNDRTAEVVKLPQ
jgi:hypothetical protein